MSPDDPRHGQTRGYHAGCRCADCSLAMSRYWKLLRVNAARGQTLRVPGHSVRRRIEALFRLGWTADEIAAEAGWNNRNDVIRLRSIKWVERKTFKTIAAVYERMCMTLPPTDGRYRTRQRNHAARNDWLPPLAWNDIDDVNERPELVPDTWDESSVDHAVVLRVLRGERKPRKLTNAEASEVVRRALAAGMTTTRIENDLGLKTERYARKDGAA